MTISEDILFFLNVILIPAAVIVWLVLLPTGTGIPPIRIP